MPAVKTKRISTLIESQLPAFITSEYELFSKFVQKYYEAQEVQGGTLDVINNIQKYADIDFYEKNLLKENDKLAANVDINAATITVEDAQSFPKKNGYIRIDDEIIFYSTRNDTEFLGCFRGVSGNTSLGDLYEASKFESTEASTHSSGSVVHNVSNLFLYALVKNFEAQYLGSFPEKYLKGEIDKRTLIKNIQNFYKAKGTNSSIKFIFNTIVAKDADNKPEVYKPKDYTYKSSNADWISVYALKCSVVSGNPKALIGSQIIQQATAEYGFASAVVDNVYSDGTRDGEPVWNIVLAPETVNGEFFISTKTELTKQLTGTASTGDRIDAFSAVGWDAEGSVLIGTETITFDKRNATQFIIKDRQPSYAVTHPVGTNVYKPVTINGTGVSLLTLGVVYNLSATDSQPYSNVGDKIQVSKPGFETADPRIVQVGTNTTRWLLSQNSDINAPTNPVIATGLSGVSTDVTSIHEDDQYYYVTSSSFPSHKILDGTSNITEKLLDQDILRIIRKQATTTTERYQTPKADTGILLNGVRTYSYRDADSIRFGILEKISVNTQGRGYTKPPFVLLDQVPNKARAVLAGQVVESIVVDTNDIYPITPSIEITSGRRAEVRAVVTGGKITSLQIDNPGEYYSSPPVVRIRDNAGRGRFATYNAIISGDGRITDFEKIDEGNFYNQDTVIVDIIPVGEDATGIPELKEWNFNRYKKNENQLDTENGYIFQNYNPVLEYGYGYLGNPKALRIALNDNINNAGTEPATKTHSPILGFAYDGNPIYGPFGYANPLDATSSITRQSSSYSINGSRSNGPSINKYPLGTFIDDYVYTHKSGSLDENNGRFCITPEFPEGTYAYFITIDSNQVPQFPYLLGANFYSLPVDSNYNSNISQLDLPKKAKRFFTAGMPRNGEGFIGQISDVSPGTVDNVAVESSSENFSINSKVYFDNEGTEGSEVEALVSSVKGKSVNYLQSKENKVVKLTTIQTAYLFENDTLRQPSSNAFGEIVGTVASDNVIVLKNVNGTFDKTGTFSADIKTFSVLVDQNSSYTEGAILNLTDGLSNPVATGEVLEGTNKQNVVKIKVTGGTWVVDTQYFIRSSNLFNTIGSRIITLTSLSDNLEPFDVNQSVALVETNANHGLGVGDKVDISINPDDATKTKIYFLRKRLYQTATLIPPVVNTQINDTGIGRFQLLNSGFDYTAGTYNNVALTGGSGSGATANIVVSSAGKVSSIEIQAKGSGYSKADYLGIADETLVRSAASTSTQRLAIYVDHVGMAAGETTLFVDSTIGYANGDLITIGDEILEITNVSDASLTVTRSQENTVDKDHYNNQLVKLYKAKYNFSNNFQIFTGANSGRIQSYDRATQKIGITYPYATTVLSANEVTQSSSFFDSSTPKRLVNVSSATSLEFKFEFSEDGTTFTPNPNINVQEFYKYKFDTSHSSMTGTYFDMSPSKNFNLETLEKTATTTLPGNSGAFTEVKFGFGSRIATNNYQTKTGTNFTNFYYYDRKNIVQSDDAYLKVISDPLQGIKTINYVTQTRFVYDISSLPLWDGSGSISYTTTGEFPIGEIDKVAVINLGLNYKKVPIIVGVDPTSDYKGAATVLYNTSSKTITGVNITNKGSNYSNPKVVITNGDGVGATFDIIVRQGQIFSITVNNPGRGYTFAPDIKIVESNVSAYALSETIGLPKSITVSNNGGAFHLDKTVGSTFQSNSIFVVSNVTGQFRKGETIKQIIDGVEVARAKVVEWRKGSNLLKVAEITGIFRENVSFQNKTTNITATLKSVFVTTFEEQITSFYDNLGFFKTDRGRLGVSNQKIADSYFYQDYSYVVKSKTPINQWRELIKSTTHPAGFKLFGQVDVEATASTEMPVELPRASHFSVIQLWDPNKNKITIESTKQTLTQTIQKIENQRIRRGVGAASSSEFNFNELRAFEIKLQQPFNGVNGVDATGNAYTGGAETIGRKTFTLLDNLNQPFTPYSVNNLIITLDGVLQEPGSSFTISGTQITFNEAPLGPSSKQTGESQTDLSSYKGVTFYAKYIAFKDNQYNDKHFKKLKNIFQRNGRYIDAANQIERNIEFIIEETIGWAKLSYPSLDWSTKQDDYQENIRLILRGLDHDVRFGGNVKIVNYVSLFDQDDQYLYITNYKTESSAIFAYAIRLAKLATRNWDYTDTSSNYLQGSKTITISSTENVAIGMYVSSGRAFPKNTKIVSINSGTQVSVNNSALANSGSGGGAPVGITDLSGTATTGTVPTDTGRVPVGDSYELPDGVIVTTPTAFSGTDQVTFSLSGFNNGTYYDASNLISKNKSWIQQTSVAWAKTQYPSLNWEDPTSTRVQATASVSTLRALDPGAIEIAIGEVDETTLCEDKNDGYETAPTLYVFPAANTVVSPTNQTGNGWELSADLELNGYIKQINITNGGSGYSSPPTVTLGGDMSGLTATATISSGSVTGITITGYTIGQRYVEVTANEQTTYVEQENYSNKEITIDGAATAEIVLGKRVGNIWITEPGNNFTSGTPIGYIRGIGGNQEHELDATCRIKKRTSFTIQNSGYGYDPDTVSVNLSWSTGSYQFTPTAKAELDEEGRVTSINIVEEGDFSLTLSPTATVDGFAPGGTYDVQTKCIRDIGFLIDAITYHLKLGGNENVVQFAQFYYQSAKYPQSEKLEFVNTELTETLATFEYAKDQMIIAMKNQGQITDPNVLVDTVTPVCAEVETSLNTFYEIVDDVFNKGKGAVAKTTINPNKSGAYTGSLTYSNYNIILDPNIPQQECEDVISGITSLYDNIDDAINSVAVTRTLPDFIDGETKEFDLFWEDNTAVKLEEEENLFLSLNAVLQKPKYTEEYPLFDAYFIDKQVIPNRIKFDVPPIWDQDFSAKSIGEPTAVEKVVGLGVGNYKRLTIDYALVDDNRSGPFLILDVLDNSVQNIEAPENLYVFLDGVLQQQGDDKSYTISGPNISFNSSITKEMKIDMRYLYGRDVGSILSIYDYSPDTYFSRSIFTITGISSSSWDTFSSYQWMGDQIGAPINVAQQRVDGTYNMIGELSNIYWNGSDAVWNLKGQNPVIEAGLDILFVVAEKSDRTYTLATADFTAVTISNFDTDDLGRKLLTDDNASWFGTFIGKSYRNPFVYLANNDKVRLEGETTFRKIKQLPKKATSREGRNGNQTSNEIFGAVQIENYVDITRGEGLSVVATITNGVVTDLTWNQRSYDPITQPTAYQYYTPPVLKFVPLNGDGGGARANVLVQKGQVISVDLIDGGSGYTKAPQVIVARRYDILTERDIGVSIINAGINPIIPYGQISINVDIDVQNVAGLNNITGIAAISMFSPVDTETDDIISHVHPKAEQVGDDLAHLATTDRTSREPRYGFVPVIDTFKGNLDIVNILDTKLDTIRSTSVIEFTNKFVTTFENLIPNDALSNVSYYTDGAYLQIDLDPTENVVYIADTSKFKSSGYLLIGDETVFYYRKLGDRFLQVQRGQEGTTAQAWVAGTFLRQIPDPISTVSAAVAVIEMESKLVAMSLASGTVATGQDRKRQLQYIAPVVTLQSTSVVGVGQVQLQSSFTITEVTVDQRTLYDVNQENIIESTLQSNVSEVVATVQTVTSEFDLTRAELAVTKAGSEFFFDLPPGGAVDGYVETVFFTDPVATRSNGEIDLVDTQGIYYVTQRSGNSIEVSNAILGAFKSLIGVYAKTNVGFTLSHRNGIFDAGASNVSGLTIADFTFYFPTLSLRDFTERGSSSFALDGTKFILMPPSIQNPVAISSSTGSIGGNIVVQDTTNFPTAGYLFTSGGTVIQYTGKTTTQFTGCSLYSGPNSINATEELIPFTI